MKNSFYYYHKQNEIILQIVLLPFTLVVWLIKKLMQIAKTRYTTRKHKLTEVQN